jgi:Uncharacterized protein conserved in bacteria
MVLSLDKRDKLANADINKVKQGLSDQGYYLQIPPPVESLLNIHLDQSKKFNSDSSVNIPCKNPQCYLH